jgi:heme A synthase
MTIEELEPWQEEFEQFHAREASLLERSKSRQQAKKYLRELLDRLTARIAGRVPKQWGSYP